MPKFTDGFRKVAEGVFASDSGGSRQSRTRAWFDDDVRRGLQTAGVIFERLTRRDRPSGYTQDRAGNVYVEMESLLDRGERSLKSLAQIAAIAVPVASLGLVKTAQVYERHKLKRRSRKEQARRRRETKALHKQRMRQIKELDKGARNVDTEPANSVPDVGFVAQMPHGGEAMTRPYPDAIGAIAGSNGRRRSLRGPR